jgi:hypothetical protein
MYDTSSAYGVFLTQKSKFNMVFGIILLAIVVGLGTCTEASFKSEYRFMYQKQFCLILSIVGPQRMLAESFTMQAGLTWLIICFVLANYLQTSGMLL